jgi:GNAT superfamily N-acetyltransferase
VVSRDEGDMSYRIREVDASADEIADTIRVFNRETAAFPELTDDELDGFHCYWWLAYLGKEPVGFAGMVPSQRYKNTGYLKRAGVSEGHRGKGLQLRFFRVREQKARAIGWTHLVSECTNTVYSANNFIHILFRNARTLYTLRTTSFAPASSFLSPKQDGLLKTHCTGRRRYERWNQLL